MLKLSKKKGHSMIKGIWGKKIGMTQIFSDKDKVVPVTVIDVAIGLLPILKPKNVMVMMLFKLDALRKKYVRQRFF